MPDSHLTCEFIFFTFIKVCLLFIHEIWGLIRIKFNCILNCFLIFINFVMFTSLLGETVALIYSMSPQCSLLELGWCKNVPTGLFLTKLYWILPLHVAHGSAALECNIMRPMSAVAPQQPFNVTVLLKYKIKIRAGWYCKKYDHDNFYILIKIDIYNNIYFYNIV